MCALVLNHPRAPVHESSTIFGLFPCPNKPQVKLDGKQLADTSKILVSVEIPFWCTGHEERPFE